MISFYLSRSISWGVRSHVRVYRGGCDLYTGRKPCTGDGPGSVSCTTITASIVGGRRVSHHLRRETQTAVSTAFGDKIKEAAGELRVTPVVLGQDMTGQANAYSPDCREGKRVHYGSGFGIAGKYYYHLTYSIRGPTEGKSLRTWQRCSN